jgi:HK97 family phage major capsid protein
MSVDIGALRKERQEAWEKVNGIFTKAGDADVPKDDRDALKSLYKSLDDIDARLVDADEGEQMRVRFQQEQKRAREVVSAVKFASDPGAESRGDAQAVKSLGAQFVTDERIREFIDRNKTGGALTRAAIGNSPPLKFSGLKALVTGASSTSAGAYIVTDRKPIVDMGTFYRPLRLRDIITNGETDSDTVDYVRQGAHTNAAAAVAEATATSGGSGVKPESSLVLAIITETVKTIAHWIPATRNALADAAQIRTLIDSFLRYGLEEELEDQILNGDGTGSNFTGVANTSGITAQAWDTNILTTTRKGRTKVLLTGRANPNAYVLHPTDWETIDLLQDNEARYYFGGPSAMGSPRLWGLPVVETEAQTVGQGHVADWRLAVLWDRQAAQILVSDSHSDFFIRNLIAILAELRAAFGVLRPAAFVELDLTA